MSGCKVSIIKIAKEDQTSYWALLDECRLSDDREHYEICFERALAGELDVYFANLQGRDVGFCVFNKKPSYAYFRKCNIPEIQDLNVLPPFRRQGIGRAMIAYCEEHARVAGYNEMGIGVGLDYSFGAAQRLYAKMGYIPDGTGVSYARQQVEIGAMKPIDDNLCLMMTKKLK